MRNICLVGDMRRIYTSKRVFLQKIATCGYESEQEWLRRLFGEVLSDVAEDSDSEQDMSDDDVASISAVRKTTHEPCFIRCDGTRWKKHLDQRKNVRNCADNLLVVIQLPVYNNKKTLG
uniref:Uncharacterized protein LOC114344666 n=1 Tax=Diabrotica virgifera virgifera TaxID=50390 RepID=A0A6P7GN24_DIAVI